ncbi:phage tail tape measure protein, partial [Deinococcus sp.]|uniref:phage tail tape measure protein n=1 Tax=Deinococcus sp. TaxID=47478 RepID=UPI0025E8182B
MSSVGSASFDVNANPARAIAALKQLQKEALATKLEITPTLDVRGLKSKLQEALKGIAGTISADVKIRSLTRTQLNDALKGLTGTINAEVKVKPITQASLDGALRSMQGGKDVKITLDEAPVRAKIAQIRADLQDLRVSVGGLLRIDADALKALATVIGKQITDLRALETNLKGLLGRSNGGGGAGAGGGGPGAGGNAYAAQLRALAADLKAGTLGTAQYEQAVRGLLTPLNAEITALRSLGGLTAQQQSRLDGLRGSAGMAQGALKGLADQTARLGGTGQQGAVAQIARDIASANSRFQTGAIGLRTYLRELQQAETGARALAPTLTAGSKAALDLQRSLQGIGAGRSNVNTQGIQNIRIELAQARTNYEQMFAAAGSSFRAQGQAAVSYQRVLAGVEGQLAKISSRANLSAADALKVANIQRQIASQQNALQGKVSPLGINGAFLIALRQIPELALAAGGSLGTMAFQAVTLGGGLLEAAKALGPLGVAFGVLGVAAVAVLGTLISLGTRGVEEVGKIQRGLNVLQADGETNLPAVSAQIRDLQASLGQVGQAFTRGDLTRAAADISKAGLSAADALTLLKSSSQLAAAEQTNLTDASGELLKNLRQYDKGVGDAAQVSSFLAKAGNLAAGSANDLSVGLGIVGTTGKQAKVEMYDLLGMLVELDNKGMSAVDVGANGLRAALTALADVTPKGTRALASLGVKIRDELGHARPAGDLIKELSSRLKGMGIEVDRATGELVGNGDALQLVSSAMGTRAAAAVLGLTGDYKAYGEQIRNSTGYSEEYARIMQQGVVPAQERLRNALKDAGGELVLSFAVPLADLLDNTLTPGIKQLGDFFSALRDGGPVLDEIKGYVYALATALIFLKA